MARVRYAKNADELERGSTGSAHAVARSARVVRAIRCVYETDAEVVHAVVPRPLEIPAHPEVEAVFAAIGSPDEAAEQPLVSTACFGVRVEYDGSEGVYPLAMPVDHEPTVARGRERYGEPRKLAQIELWMGDPPDGGKADVGFDVSARVERQGVDFLRVTGRSVEVLDPVDIQRVGYCFRAFPACDPRATIDPDPQLVRVEWSQSQTNRWRLEGGLDLGESSFDPVADLPVRRLVEFEFSIGRLSINRRVLRPVPAEWLAPFLHQRYDDPATVGVDV